MGRLHLILLSPHKIFFDIKGQLTPQHSLFSKQTDLSTHKLEVWYRSNDEGEEV